MDVLMPRKRYNAQLFALPDRPPRTIEVGGRPYALAGVFKHDFFAATCLYEAIGAGVGAAAESPADAAAATESGAGAAPESGADAVAAAQCGAAGSASFAAVAAAAQCGAAAGASFAAGSGFSPAALAVPRIVVKFGRRQPFCGLPLDWVGRFNRDHEEAVYRCLAGVEGVPRWLGRVGELGYAIEHIRGRPLDHPPAPPPGFFDRLRRIFDAIHARGVAYGDANKRSNILIAPDGGPFLIDYQLALRRRDDWPWPLRAVVGALVGYIAGRDLYHLCKHKRRIAPREMTAQEEAISRDRGGLHVLHRKLTKPYRSLRRAFLRRQHERGRLVSPTADLEDHYQPEKETWRKKEP